MQFPCIYIQWRILTGPDPVMCVHPVDQSPLPRRWDTMIGHAWVLSPSLWPEGQGAIIDSSSSTAWNGRGCFFKEGWADKKSGAVQAPKRKNKLHLHVSLFKIFPGAPQIAEEYLCKYKFTRWHNLHVKWGQFSHEVHKPALKQF